MCVSREVALSGLLLTSTLSPLPNPVFATNGAMSEMLFWRSHSTVRLVKEDSDDMSEMLLKRRYRFVNPVKPDKGVISEILLPESSSHAQPGQAGQ